MKVSFGARIVCPIKKLVKPTDSDSLKAAIEKNISLLEKCTQAKGLQYYLGEDEYIFSRGKGINDVKFFLKVKEKSGKKASYQFYGGYNDSLLPINSFYEILMAHLCKKFNVPASTNFKSWLKDFCNFVDRQKKIASCGFKFEKPKYVKALPAPVLKKECASEVKIKPRKKLTIKEIMDLPVEQAEYALFGTSILGGRQKFSEFLKSN